MASRVPEGQDSNLKLGHFGYLTDRWSRLIQLHQEIKHQEHQSSAYKRLKDQNNSSIDEEMETSSEGEIVEQPEAEKIAKLEQKALQYVEKLAKYQEVPRFENKEVVEAQLEAYCQDLSEWFQVIRPMMVLWTEPEVLDDAPLDTELETVDFQKPSTQQLFPPGPFEQALKLRETIQICKEVVKLKMITLEQNKFLEELRHWTEKCEASDKEMENMSSIPISSQITTRTQKMIDQCRGEINVSNEQTYVQVGKYLEATMHVVNQVHSLMSGKS